MTSLFADRKSLVLIVEDDALLAMMAEDILQGAGFSTLSASNADEALVVLEKTPGIEIVFTDIDMPGSMDGLTFAEVVRVRWPDIHIAVTSGGAVRHQRFPQGSVFFRKPYRDSELIATLSQFAA